MRVLVEQSTSEAQKWIDNLKAAKVGIPADLQVHVLMGGVDTEKWFLHPETPAILIGTQDMLLSRALNRGYGASRFHWPIDFGLLNNDCLWIFDEPQLMGSGVSTSAQLAGLRQSLSTFGSCLSVWMSATLEPSWLDTIDFRDKFPEPPLELNVEDYREQLPLHKRMTATKTLAKLDANSSKDMKEVAKKVWSIHGDSPGTQTLVILNTVDRAKAVYDELHKVRKKSGAPKLLLVHSRFRPHERQKLNAQLQSKGDETKDRIIVATQVVEAGVDISSHTLITELASWSSIVQRIGRCNRTGDDGPGQVFWIDLNTEKQALPYEPSDLEIAKRYCTMLEGQNVSPQALDQFKQEQRIVLPFAHKHVLRRRDLLDLFDTTSDLSGNDIDIARYVRGDDPETDVQVFWRELGKDKVEQTGPHRLELCNVPVGAIKAFLDKSDKQFGYNWDHLDEEWRLIRDPRREVRPGMTILLPTTVGGYSDLGWDAASTVAVVPVQIEHSQQLEGTGSDPNSSGSGPALSIAAHTQNVCAELASLLGTLTHLPSNWVGHLTKAARWHDVGKAHDAFQAGIRRANPNLPSAPLWAKSGNSGRLIHGRQYFRHELASALAILQQDQPFAVAYLVAAHHGKVRLSIRSLPNEKPPNDPDTPFALGVHHGDTLPVVDLGGESCPAITLDLTPMRLGGDRSWTAAALSLREEIGPFRLAYLESLLRAADLWASQLERKAVNHA
jgi:CRISPR-associated endonuclease/helicase Cas3